MELNSVLPLPLGHSYAVREGVLRGGPQVKIWALPNPIRFQLACRRWHTGRWPKFFLLFAGKTRVRLLQVGDSYVDVRARTFFGSLVCA